MALNKFILGFSLLISFSAVAVEISFPIEELPSEAFPPRLDSPQAVATKLITFKNHFEPELSYGWLLDEPFYQSRYLAVGLTYSWNEFDSVTLRFMNWSKGLSDYSNQFGSTAAKLQFARASGPEIGYTLAYNYRLLYGKVSFSKDFVRPATLAVTYEAGMIKYGSKNLPLAGIGILNSLYFSKNWSLDIGLRLLLRMALDPLSADLRGASPVPPESSFSSKMRISTSLDVGVQYLF